MHLVQGVRGGAAVEFGVDAVAVGIRVAEIEPTGLVRLERKVQRIVGGDGRCVIFTGGHDHQVRQFGTVADTVKGFTGQIVGCLEFQAAEHIFHLVSGLQVLDREALVGQHRGLGERLLAVVDVHAEGLVVVFVPGNGQRETDEIGVEERGLEVSHRLGRRGAFRQDGGGHVHQAADREVPVVGIQVTRRVDDTVPEHVAREADAAAFGDDQRGDAGNVRAGHRRTLHQAVFVVRKRTEDLVAFLVVSARRGDVHPLTVAGIVGAVVIRSNGADCHGTFIIGGCAEFDILIARREDDQAACHRTDLESVFIHAGVGVEIVDGHAVGVGHVVDLFIAPAVLGDDGAVVGTPFDGAGAVAAALFAVLEDLRRHQPDTGNSFGIVAAGDAADAFPIVVDRGNRAGYMGAVLALDDIGAAVHKVETVDGRAVRIAP